MSEETIYVGRMAIRRSLTTLVVGIFLMLIAILARLVYGNATGETVSLVVIGGVLFCFPWFRVMATDYRVTTRHVTSRTGWWVRRSADVALTNVETVRVVQGWFGRLIGTGEVQIWPAGAPGAPLLFKEVADPHGVAERIRLASGRLADPGRQ